MVVVKEEEFGKKVGKERKKLYEKEGREGTVNNRATVEIRKGV